MLCSKISVWSLLALGAEKLRNAQGWRRYGLALVFGLLAAFAFPPFSAWPVLGLSFPACVFLLQGCATRRQAFAVGWSFAFGLLTVSLYWIAGALFVDLKSFWWLVPFAVAGLPALFALYYGLAAAVAHWWGLEKSDGLLIFALVWFLADYARGHLFTGFPWDVMGYVWADNLPLMQMASVVGIYGLTLFVLLLAVVPALMGRKNPSPQDKAKILAIVGAALFALFLAVSTGAWRVAQTPDNIVPDVRFRLVQPNVSQSEKWKHEDRHGRFERLIATTFKDIDKAAPPITHIVWPETATPFLLMEDETARQMIATPMAQGLAPTQKRVLLTGGLRRKEDAKGITYYLNSFLIMDEKARIVGAYDKHHLVPFGEYIPFADYLPIRSVVAMGADFMSGEGIRSLRTFGLPPLSPLVCYEAIFPNEVADREDPPRLLVNVTNDGWYEGTIGPAQHFAISRLRAVEEGIPLIRVANKGVVAMVDAVGRIKAQTESDQAGTVDSDLPQALPTPTIYTQFGDEIVFLAAWGLFFVAFLLKKKKSS